MDIWGTMELGEGAEGWVLPGIHTPFSQKDPDGAERGRRGGCKSGGADESTAGPFGGGGVGCYFLF